MHSSWLRTGRSTGWHTGGLNPSVENTGQPLQSSVDTPALHCMQAQLHQVALAKAPGTGPAAAAGAALMIEE